MRDSEPRVIFQLPLNRRPSICQQNAEPTLRERVKGSPRFPHKIAPTTSLNALVETEITNESMDDTKGMQMFHSGVK